MIEATVRKICHQLEQQVGQNMTFAQVFSSLEKQVVSPREMVVLEVVREACKELAEERAQNELSLQRQTTPLTAVGM